jgi:energy-coupling factor transporter ATP-binding protein EcfA2
VIRRFFVHNYRCLESFELLLAGHRSVLLIGNNGSGKTTVGEALGILRKIGRGINVANDLVKAKDFAHGTGDPMRFEIEVEIGAVVYGYALAFERATDPREVRVFEEAFLVNNEPILIREKGEMRFGDMSGPVRPWIDVRIVALPLLQERSEEDPLHVFKQWLDRLLILRPIPSMIGADSEGETLSPNPAVTDIGPWFSGLIANTPLSYSTIDRYLRQVFPDFKDIRNPIVAQNSRRLGVQFAVNGENLRLGFDALSDGEKCFVICALVLATHEEYPSAVCFWDEPDNYLSLSEVGHFLIELQKAFLHSGQFIATSHNPEAVRRFSRENTFLIHRKSHFEPARLYPISQIPIHGDLVDALIRGDVEP